MFQTLLQVFTVEPSSNNFTPQLASTFVVANDTLYPGYIDPSFGNVVQIPYGNPLSAGDLQGRSLSLGTPTKVTVTSSIQPQVVLGLPPMHVDYICDANNTGTGCTPTALNLSALPSKYYSQYQTQQSSSNQSANTNTTSYTFATRVGRDQILLRRPPRGFRQCGSQDQCPTDPSENRLRQIQHLRQQAVRRLHPDRLQ